MVSPTAKTRRVLLTGATGYVGGRLLQLLEERGGQVRCLARRPEFLRPKVAASTEVVAGDVLEPATLDAALEGVDTAYYLIHSMASEHDFEVMDRMAAQHFAAAAARAGVRRIIYLGGLGKDQGGLSSHLRSRHEVGRVLREHGTQVVEFRASIVIGSGSLSFQMIRALVERLPVMLAPSWVRVRAQPIAIRDLLAYLMEALDWQGTESRVFEVGGADQMSYGEVMRTYARVRGIHLRMVPVPMLTPWLSSLWLGLVTPLYARIGRRLILSIKHPTVVEDRSALDEFKVRPRGVEAAVRRALEREDQAFMATRWSDALSSSGKQRSWEGVDFKTRQFDSRTIDVGVTPVQAFAPIRRIGGKTGWYACNALWRIRAALDLLVGGVGFRRGRPHPDKLRAGDTLDFWRVEVIEPDRRLRLFAEMKLPGRAWLEFEVEPREGGGSTIRQTASFDPVGLIGRLYWYALIPVHILVFRGMLNSIGRAAEGQVSEGGKVRAGRGSGR